MAATPCSTGEMFEALAELRYFTGHFKERYLGHLRRLMPEVSKPK